MLWHTADDSMDAICKVFDDRIISKGLWLSRSLILVTATLICGGTKREKCIRIILALLKLSRMK
jgi:hypothetical protein